MLGIPLNRKNGKEGLGGGGKTLMRRELSMAKLENSLVNSGQKIMKVGNISKQGSMSSLL